MVLLSKKRRVTEDGRTWGGLIQMTGNVGQRVWDTTGIAPGTYSVQFIVDDQVVGNEKLVIEK